MSEYLRLLAAFLAAVNPPAVALAMAANGPNGDRRPAWLVPAIGVSIAAAIFVLVAVTAEPLLDALQIEPETFRVAAGLVMAVGGGLVLWSGRWQDGGHEPGLQAAIFPLALPLIAGPWVLVALVSYAVDQGAGLAFAAVIPPAIAAGALVLFRPLKGTPALDATARILGALLVAVAAGLVVEGVRAI